MSDGTPGDRRQPGVPEAGRLAALDAYLDAPVAPGPAGGVAAPTLDEPGMAMLIDRLRSLPQPAWDAAVPLASLPDPSAPPTTAPVPAPAPGEADGPRARRLTNRRLVRRSVRTRATRTIVVGAVALAVAAAVALVALTGRSPSPLLPRLPAALTSWRLAGILAQTDWTAAGGTAASSVTVTCPTAATCFADDPGAAAVPAVVEVSTDGGSSWQAVATPGGTRFTSGLTCTGAAVCLAAGYSGIPTGPDGSGLGTPSILATADGGATWSTETLPAGVGRIIDLACAAPTDCVGAGYGTPTTADPQAAPLAVVTVDGGGSWSVVPLPGPFALSGTDGLACTSTGRCSLVGATDFSRSPTGAAAGGGAALYSDDGGESWSRASVPAGEALVRAVSCSETSSCTALANAPAQPGPGSSTLDPYGPSVALTSTDGGQTWSAPGSSGLVPSTLISISCPTAANCWAVGTRLATTGPDASRGVVVSTHDGGAGWTTDRLPTEATGTRRGDTGLAKVDIEAVTSLSCPVVGGCVAFGLQGTLASPTERQIVLTNTAG